MADWTVSADKLTYTFTLRDGLKWHDGSAGDGERFRRLAEALGHERRWHWRGV